MLITDAVRAADDLLRDLTSINAARKELAESARRLADQSEAQRAAEQDWDRAAAVIRSFSDDHSENLKADIERLVSYALTSVFAEPMHFKVVTRVLRGQTNIEFALEQNGVERPILGSHGGGVAQVVGFILRATVLLLTKSLRPVLVLDEPFSQVSSEYLPRLAAFLRELVDSTPLQLIVVSHEEELAEVSDVHYRFTAVAGLSRVSLVRSP